MESSLFFDFNLFGRLTLFAGGSNLVGMPVCSALCVFTILFSYALHLNNNLSKRTKRVSIR